MVPEDVLLSRKPEASLHLPARKMESKAPHLSPVPHARGGGCITNGDSRNKSGFTAATFPLVPCTPSPCPPARAAQPLQPKGKGAAAKGSRELAAFLQKLL